MLSLLKKKDAASALVIGSSLHYLIKQIDAIFEKWLSALVMKTPGALITSGEYPKIIWVRMLKRPAAEILQDTQGCKELFALQTNLTRY